MPDRDWFNPEQAPDPFDSAEERTVPTTPPRTRSTEEHYSDAIRALDDICSRQQ